MTNAELIDSVKVRPKFLKSIPTVMLDTICDWKVPDYTDRCPSFMLTLWWVGSFCEGFAAVTYDAMSELARTLARLERKGKG